MSEVEIQSKACADNRGSMTEVQVGQKCIESHQILRHCRCWLKAAIYSLLRAMCALLADFMVMVTCLVHACVRMMYLLTISSALSQ